jgi:GNAT superfamily N-acetyltransferase
MPSCVSRLGVREFQSGDVQAAAELLAAAHARDLAAAPAGLRLGERYAETRGCRNVLDQLLASPRASAVVAVDGGRVRGFMAGERQLFAPEDFASIYAEPRSTNVPLHGHAIAAGVDAQAAYEAMYAALAREWVASGFFVHNVAMSAFDRDVVDAWQLLGFGRKSVCAVRSTRRVEADVAHPASAADDDVIAQIASEITIEEIRGRDEELLEQFHRRLMIFQTDAPMFWPYTGESDAKVRAVRREALVSGQGFAYIARTLEGEAVGSLLFVPAVFLSPLLVCERMVYLWEGFVDDAQRARGVGSMLLSHALASLYERGIKWVALHFVSGNPGGGRFWPSKGFVPVEFVMHRHVDERVAWARGCSA